MQNIKRSELIVNIELNNDVKYILDKLNETGEGFLVGGCLRDIAIGKGPRILISQQIWNMIKLPKSLKITIQRKLEKRLE